MAACMSQLYLRAHEVDAAIRKLYSGNGYSVLSQVRNGTGQSNTVRTADMLAVSTWPSRGLFLEGFEVKSDKGDLRRELANPAKADEIAQYCSWWWIACPEGLADGLEIPPTWGVITVNAKLIAKVAKRGTPLEPKALDILLVCSILRNFSEGYVHRSEVAPLVEKARKEEQEDLESRRSNRLKNLESAVSQFKEHSGIDLLADNGYPAWNLGRIGEAVRMVAALGNSPLEEIKRAKEALQAGMGAIDAALQVIEKPLLPAAPPNPAAPEVSL